MRNVNGPLIGAPKNFLVPVNLGGTGVKKAADVPSSLGLVTKDTIDQPNGAISLDANGKVSFGLKGGGASVCLMLLGSPSTLDKYISIKVTDFDMATDYQLTAGKYPVRFGIPNATRSDNYSEMNDEIYMDISSYTGTDTLTDTFTILGREVQVSVPYIAPLIVYPKNGSTGIDVSHLTALFSTSLTNFNANIGAANAKGEFTNWTNYNDYGPLSKMEFGYLYGLMTPTELITPGMKYRLEVSGNDVNLSTQRSEYSVFTIADVNPGTFIGVTSPLTSGWAGGYIPSARKNNPIAGIMNDNVYEVTRFTPQIYHSTNPVKDFPAYLESDILTYKNPLDSNSSFVYSANGEVCVGLTPQSNAFKLLIEQLSNGSTTPSDRSFPAVTTKEQSLTINYSSPSKMMAISDNGNIIVVPCVDTNTGRYVQIFHRTTAGNWVANDIYQVQDAGLAAGDSFGDGIALSGDGKTAFIPAYQYYDRPNSGKQNSGVVFVLHLSDTGAVTSIQKIPGIINYAWLGQYIATNYLGDMFVAQSLVQFPQDMQSATQNRPVVYRLQDDGNFALSESYIDELDGTDIKITGTYPKAIGGPYALNAAGDVLVVNEGYMGISGSYMYVLHFANGKWTPVEKFKPDIGNDFDIGSLPPKIRRDSSEIIAGGMSQLSTGFSQAGQYVMEVHSLTKSLETLYYQPQLSTMPSDSVSIPVTTMQSQVSVGYDGYNDGNGNTVLAVGNPKANSSLGNGSGLVYVTSSSVEGLYNSLGGVTDTLIPPSSTFSGYFGAFVKFINKSLLLISEPFTSGTGKIHVFKKNTSGAWAFDHSIASRGSNDNGLFGSAIAVTPNGNLLFVTGTAPVNGTATRVIYVFKMTDTNGTYSEVATIGVPNSVGSDALFGAYLACSQTGQYLGASFASKADSSAPASGGLFVFSYANGVASLVDTISANAVGGNNSAVFAQKFAISSTGSTIAVVGNSATDSAKVVCIYDLANGKYSLTGTKALTHNTSGLDTIASIGISAKGDTVFTTMMTEASPNEATTLGSLSVYYRGYDNDWKEVQKFYGNGYGNQSMGFGMQLVVSPDDELLATFAINIGSSGADFTFHTFAGPMTVRFQQPQNT